jgi:hypothetical protein
VSPAAAWTAERLAGSPPALREAILAALPADPALPVSEALAEGALALYASVAGGCLQRADALPLLAADALATHALEAQAEADPAGLAALAARMEGRIGRLAPEETPQP